MDGLAMQFLEESVFLRESLALAHNGFQFSVATEGLLPDLAYPVGIEPTTPHFGDGVASLGLRARVAVLYYGNGQPFVAAMSVCYYAKGLRYIPLGYPDFNW